MLKPALAHTLIAASLALCAGPAAAQAQPTYLPLKRPEVPVSISDAQARANRPKIAVKKIILVGDSTMQVNSGWGGAFCARHVASTVTCVDLGRGGRSTFSYRAEGAWDLALAEAKTPGYEEVYILIQFGHNDQPGKPGNSTDLDTEFGDNLRHFVEDARAVGAVPVLVTPLTRRSFVNGSLQDNLWPWAEKVRAIAKETNAPLIDLHARSVAAVQAMGPVASLELTPGPPSPELIAAARTGTTLAVPGAGLQTTPARPPAGPADPGPAARPTTTFDYTHLGEKGAEVFAAMVAQGLAEVRPDLRKQLAP
jgi:lysophospholipase L1-like esterase